MNSENEKNRTDSSQKTTLSENEKGILDEKKMSLVEHLEELRWRIIFSILSWCAGAVGGWFFAGRIISYIKSLPGIEGVKLILIRPPEAFFVRMKIAVIAGFLIALPIIIYQVLSFVLPGLTPQEKGWVLKLLPGSVILFYGGAGFAVFVMLPIALNFFLGYMVGGIAEPTISLGEYVNFVTTLVILGGFVFQTPVVLFFLTMIGVLSSEKLRKGRRYAIIIIFIVAALASPPDPFSQVITAIPMIILYELGIYLSRLARR